MNNFNHGLRGFTEKKRTTNGHEKEDNAKKQTAQKQGEIFTNSLLYK